MTFTPVISIFKFYQRNAGGAIYPVTADNGAERISPGAR